MDAWACALVCWRVILWVRGSPEQARCESPGDVDAVTKQSLRTRITWRLYASVGADLFISYVARFHRSRSWQHR